MLKTKYKNSALQKVLTTYPESVNHLSFIRYVERYRVLNNYFYDKYFSMLQLRELINCVLKDMLHLVIAWRHIRGYPTRGQTTYTNSKTAKKNKILFNFRVLQFNKAFGTKKRNIYPTLVKAEYTNRLWHTTWWVEWYEASRFAKKMAKLRGRGGVFNPVLMAAQQTNGYTRVGKAAKIGKSKKLVKLFTIGVPIFFTRFIYYSKLPRGFPERLILREEVNKKLGKRVRKTKKK